MKKLLSPDQAIAYCAIALSELTLNPRNENSIVSSGYINFDFAGVSMPAIDIDPPLSFDQRLHIGSLCHANRSSSKFRFAKILHHYRRKISKCLNSRKLEAKQYQWMRDPLNHDIDVNNSPRVVTELRLHQWAKRASDKAVPGLVGKSYTEYLNGVFARII
jgi:hypothetical protein